MNQQFKDSFTCKLLMSGCRFWGIHQNRHKGFNFLNKNLSWCITRAVPE
jgi:hypothetical protein